MKAIEVAVPATETCRPAATAEPTEVRDRPIPPRRLLRYPKASRLAHEPDYYPVRSQRS